MGVKEKKKIENKQGKKEILKKTAVKKYWYASNVNLLTILDCGGLKPDM